MLKRTRFIISVGLVAITLVSGCARSKSQIYQPKLTSINIVDRNGLSETVSNKDRLEQYEKVNFVSTQPYQKVMRIYSRRPNGDIYANITTYHENGQVKQYLEMVNNRAFGKYNEWFDTGQLKIDATVIGGVGDVGPSDQKSWLFDGMCRAFDYEGHLEAEILYSKGALEGDTIYYHPNGKIWKRIPFQKGNIQGVEEIYLEDGSLLQTSEYVNGVKNGLSIRYWNESKIAAQETYIQGKLDHGIYDDLKGNRVASIDDGEGYRALFSKNGLAELHEYHHGELEGEVQMFAPNGMLFNTYHVRNGLKHGEEIEYYEMSKYQSTPLPKISINWFNGSVQGVVKTWYPNGNQESQKQVSKNQKNGLFTAWYEDGSLMMIEDYENEKLLSGKYFKKGQKMPISKVREGNGIATIFDSEGNYTRKINYIKGVPMI